MRRFTEILLFLLLIHFHATAHHPSPKTKTQNIDSLRAEGFKNLFTDTLKCAVLQKQAVLLAKQENNKEKLVIGYTYLTITYISFNQPRAATLYADSAWETGNALQTNTGLGYANMAMGMLKSYVDEDGNGESLNFLFNAYSFLGEVKDFQCLTRIAAKITYHYEQQADLEKTKKYATETVENAKKSGDMDAIAIARNVYGYYLTYKAQNEKTFADSAIAYYKESINIVEQNNNKIISKNILPSLYINLAVLYFEHKLPGEEPAFLTCVKKAIALSQKYDIRPVYRNSMGLMGDYYMQKKDYAMAEQLFLKGIAYQKSLPYQNYYTLSLFYSALKRLSAQKNDLKKYYEYDTTFLRYKELRDREAVLTAAEEADAKYESAITRNKIELLEKENKLKHTNELLALGISLLLLTGLLFVIRIYYLRKKLFSHQIDLLTQQQKNIELELELKKKENSESIREKLLVESRLLQAQMNPHFVFNALSSIQGILLKNGSTQIAIKYLNKFSTFMRQTLIFFKKDKVPLDETIELIQNYICIQQLRFEKPFTFELNYGNLLNAHIMIPSMLILPFVENAIEHGLKPLKDNREKKLSISFYKDTFDDNYILCIVEDNGIGFEVSKRMEKESKHKSLALQINTERMQKLMEENPKSGFKIEEVIKDGIVSGTRVSLTIPSLL